MSKEDFEEIVRGFRKVGVTYPPSQIVTEKLIAKYCYEYAKQQNNELLEALKGLVNDVKNKPNDTRYATHIKIAEAAIKKASS